MSQNTLMLPTTGTVSGLQMTQYINNALDTLNTMASGPSAPGSPEAGQLWHDTANNILKLRSLDNTTWIPFLQINEAGYTCAPQNTPAGTNDRLNRLINAGMQIDQMNEGSSYALSSSTPSYTADQWLGYYVSSGAAGVTVQRVTDAPAGFVNSLKVTVGTGSGSLATTDFLQVYSPIEANNLNDLNFGTPSAQALSLSFWVKSSIAGTFAVALQNAAGNRAMVNKFTITSAGTWTFITIPNIPGDQSGTWAGGSNAMLNVSFTAAAGSYWQTSALGSWQGGAYLVSSTQTTSHLTTSGATFQVTGAQLNSGAFCQPFDKCHMQQELQICERYFEKSYDIGVSPGTAATPTGSLVYYAPNTVGGMNGSFQVKKRTDPTMVFYSPATGASGKIADISSSADVAIATANGPGQSGFSTNWASVSAHVYELHWTANARM